MDTGNFYEYSQLIKTIFFKYKMRRRFKEMRDLIKKAVDDLSQASQPDLTCDVFEIYYNEHVLKMQGTGEDVSLIEDEYLFNLCTVIHQSGDKTRLSIILKSVASNCVSPGFVTYNHKICGLVGKIYFDK